MLKEFQDFLQKGSVVDLAVAVIIGGAFGAIIDSVVNDIFMPFIGILIGGLDFTGLAFQIGDAKLLYGNFIQAVINFLIISFAMFIVIRNYNKLRTQEEATPPSPTNWSSENR